MSLLNPASAIAVPQLDDRDILRMAHQIKYPLHHCTNTSACGFDQPCDMCYHATRLVMTATVPLVAHEIIEKFHNMLGWRCSIPHPGGD